MPMTPHIEKHFTATPPIRDIVIGMSDGMTVPFALAAGLTGVAGATSSLVVTAGFAEVAAGSIAMGLGGYLAGRTDAEHYASEREREVRETEIMPEAEAEEVAAVFREYGIPEVHIWPVVDALRTNQKSWVDFMMRFELGLEEPDPRRARTSALTIAASYIGGGMIPLAPYMLVRDLDTAFWGSVLLTLLALFIFGYVKGHLTGLAPVRGALQTVLIGGLAAGAAYTLAKWLG